MNPAQILDKARALFAAGDLAGAHKLLLRLLGSHAEDPGLLRALGEVEWQMGKLGPAIRRLRLSVAFNPYDAGNQALLGEWLFKSGALKEAEVPLRAAFDLGRADPAVLEPLAEILTHRGAFAEALPLLRRNATQQAGVVNAQMLLAIALLRLGYFEEGWRYYRSRNQRADFNQNLMPWVCRDPTAGLDLSGKTVALLYEQGLGDELMFMRFASRLKARCGRLLLLVSAKLRPIVQAPFADAVLTAGEDGPEPDLVLLHGDLPTVLGCHAASDIPPPLRLAANPMLLARLRAQLEALGPPPYWGLTWRAGLTPQEDAQMQERHLGRARVQAGEKLSVLRKAVPLDVFCDRLPPVGTYVSVQRKPQSDETATLSGLLGAPVHDFSALNNDLPSLLALLDLLDGYYCVSNTSVHMRAGLGKPSHVYIPHPPEWRWMIGPGRSPWFPECPVLRQGPDGSWPEAFV